MGTLDGDGSATGLGRRASHVVEDQEGSNSYTLRSHTRTTYDRWGQPAQEARLLDGSGVTERWVVSETTRDFRGRTTRERQIPRGGTGPYTTVEYHHDPAGRVIQKRIDTTSDPAAGTRIYALVEYTYGASGLVTVEKGSATASTGAAPWTGSGASAERRFAHDAFGHVVQEATRLATNSWKIDRASFDTLDRPLTQTSYATAASGAIPPASGTTLSGDRVVHQFWYNATTGLLDWEQVRGEGSRSKVSSTIYRAYDGHERVREERACRVPGNVGGLPSCGSGNWLRQTLLTYDVEDRVTLRKVLGTPDSESTILSWDETLYDTRGRAYESRTRWSKTGPTIPTSCTDGAVCEVMASRAGYDVRDRAVVSAAPGLTDTTWRITKTTFDGLGRRRQVTDPLGNVTTLARNAAGLATAKTEQEVSDPGGLGTKTWVTEFGFDALGRAVEVRLKGKQDADPQRIVKRTLDARGLTTAQWTPLGSASAGDAYSTLFTIDGLGRLTKEERSFGDPDEDSTRNWQTVSYEHDFAGRRTKITVPVTKAGGTVENQVTEFTYDAQGRRTKRCLPDFRQEVSAYGSSGQLNTLTVTNAGANCSAPGTKQIVQASTWDDAGRRTQLTLTTPTADAAHYGGTKKQTWTWDALDRLEKSTDENVDGSADDDAIVRYKYNSLGHPLEEGFGESSGAARWKVLSAYDRRGARQSLTYPTAVGGSGTVLALTADSLGRLTQITEGATVVAALTHIGAGRLAKIASQDGSLWEGLDWDAAGRRGRGRVTLSGATQFEEEIAFDADDRVLSVQWPHLKDADQRPQVQQYGYDEQARLLKVEQGYGTWNGTTWTFPQYSSFHDFRLDEQGNWAEHKDGAGASFVSPTIAKDNAYTAWPVSGGSTLSFVLDDTGRFVYERPVAGGGKYLYKHDGLGRLVSAQRIGVPGKADLTTTYGYTADGRLAWRKEGAAAREWLIYDGSQAVVQTTDSALSWTHVWAGGRLVRSTKHPAGTVYHPHQDRLGSIVVVTRSGGPDRALYDPYGRLVATFSTITNDTFAVPYGYAGARWEATSGLYQMGARWYDPELGRFIEQDPIGEAGGLNLYAYVGSSPTLWVDPTGLARYAAMSQSVQARAQAELNGGCAQCTAARERESQETGARHERNVERMADDGASSQATARALARALAEAGVDTDAAKLAGKKAKDGASVDDYFEFEKDANGKERRPQQVVARLTELLQSPKVRETLDLYREQGTKILVRMGDLKSTASYKTTAEFTAGGFVGKLPTEAQQAQLAQLDRDPAARAQGYRLAETWSRRPGAPSITIDESRIGGSDKLAALLRQDLAHEIGHADQASRDPVQYQHDVAEADKVKGTKAYPQTAAEQYASSYQKAALSELGLSK